MSNINNYQKHSINNTHIKTSFELLNIPLALANSLRRGFSSLVPTVTFDDTWYEEEAIRSILINTNTSALHNEFLSHRLALIPLNMTGNSNIQIKTIFRKDNGTRDFAFVNPELVPIFTLKIKNDNLNKDNRDKDGFLEVNSSHFNIENDIASKYLLTDPYTRDPIIIDKLKSNVSNEDDGEELDIICRPRISMGKINARNDPTGTVTFQYKVDESKVDSTFELKLQYLNNERVRKGLEVFTELEIKQLKRSFELLDKERVFYRNVSGDPNLFQMSVETNGFLNPDQIIIDTLDITTRVLRDILNSISIKSVGNQLAIITNSKVVISETTGNKLGTSIIVKHENHTIGNILAHYTRYNYANEEANSSILSYAGYRMNHPLIEEIECILTLKHIEHEGLVDNIKEMLFNKIPIEFEDITNWDIIYKMSLASLRELLSVIIFIKSINLSIKDLAIIKSQFTQLTNVSKTSYLAEDGELFHTRFNSI